MGKKIFSISILVAALVAPASVFSEGRDEGRQVVLEDKSVRTVFPKSKDYAMTSLTFDGHGQKSVISSISAVFNYRGTEKHATYFSDVERNAGDFSEGEGVQSLPFSVVSKRVGERDFVVDYKDRYLAVRQAYKLLENPAALEVTCEFEAMEDTLLSFFSFFPKIRFSGTDFERYYPSFKITDGKVVPAVKKYAEKTFMVENQPVSPKMENWLAVKDPKTGDGIVIFFPDELAGSFIQNARAYLTVGASCIQEKLFPKGKKGSVTLFIVPFKESFDGVVKEWSERLGFASKLPREEVSPTGGALSENAELAMWTDVPERDILREEPVPSRKLEAIRLTAAKGETESFQVAVMGRESMPRNRKENMSLFFSALKSEDGKSEIPAKNIYYGQEEYLNVRFSLAPNAWSGETPDIISERQVFFVEPGKNSTIFAAVRTPENIPAGKYKGTLELRQGTKPLFSVPLEVTVRDYKLPTKRHLSTWIVPNPIGLNAVYDNAKTYKLYPKFVENVKDHRASYQYATPHLKFADGSAEIEKLDLDGFKKSLDDCLVNMRMPMVNCRMFAIGADHVLKQTPFGKPEDTHSPLWTERYKKAAVAVRDFLRKNNYQERVCFEMFDEPDDKAVPDMIKAAKLLKEIFPEARLTYWGPYDKRLYGIINVWTGGWDSFSPATAAERTAAGDMNFVYNTPFASVGCRGDYMRLGFWWLWRHKVNGFYQWQTHNWANWIDGGHGWDANNNASWFYPGENGPVNTLRWERMREGLEDYEHLWLLERAVSGADKKDISSEDAKNLAEARAALAMTERFFETRDGICSMKPGRDLHAVRENIMEKLEKIYKFVPEEERN